MGPSISIKRRRICCFLGSPSYDVPFSEETGLTDGKTENAAHFNSFKY